MKHFNTLSLVAAAVFLSVGLAPAAPARTEAEVGVLVTNLICKTGRRLQRYEQPKIKYFSDRREWWFFYTLKPPGMPGGHFTVIVDADGKTTYRGGR